MGFISLGFWSICRYPKRRYSQCLLVIYMISVNEIINWKVYSKGLTGGGSNAGRNA